MDGATIATRIARIATTARISIIEKPCEEIVMHLLSILRLGFRPRLCSFSRDKVRRWTDVIVK
jgi:hypothetical protein